MNRCAIYLRVSTPGQAERSLPDQENACRALAAEHGLEIVHVFRDDGISAWKAEAHRPAFEKMREAAEAGDFDALIVWDTDRLTRGSGRNSLLAVRWQLQDVGVRLLSVNQPVIDDTDLAELVDVIDGQRAQRESRAKSDRARRGAKRRAREGKFSGHAPFGYRWANGGLEPDPDSAPLVRQIFADWLDGVPQAEVARRLQATGIPTARGGRWHQGTVAQILKNPVYVGRFRYDGEVHEGDHPALVTDEDFRRAQALMAPKKARGRAHGRVAAHHLLSRMLVCGQCGEVMLARAGVRNKGGSYYRTYICPTSSGKVAGSCSMPPIRQADIDTAVLDHFTKHVIDTEATKEAFRARRDATVARLAGERDSAARRYADAKKQFERARDLAVSGTLDPSDLDHYRQQRNEAEAASNAALDRYNEARAAELPEDLEAKVAEKLTALAETVAGRVDGGGDAVARQRAQLQQVFERFVVHEGDVDPAKVDLQPVWPPLSPGGAIVGPADAEALLDTTPDLDEKRLHDRMDDPESAVAVGDADEAIAFTVLPELRADVIEGWGLACQPVVERMPLSLSAAGDVADIAGSAGTKESPTPTADTLVSAEGSPGSAHGRNNVEGLAT
ncbi:recombinase family protein [Miltoncostaea marina]|uniref:recombinase family protein n=1 Tax=Miltoncostaea marina TaxID=2843215 RepID=UPI001C3D1F35|nr:recombinase family protein [Miltoncostaea marina]